MLLVMRSGVLGRIVHAHRNECRVDQQCHVAAFPTFRARSIPVYREVGQVVVSLAKAAVASDNCAKRSRSPSLLLPPSRRIALLAQQPPRYGSLAVRSCPALHEGQSELSALCRLRCATRCSQVARVVADTDVRHSHESESLSKIDVGS